jgi:hypothetical protein
MRTAPHSFALALGIVASATLASGCVAEVEPPGVYAGYSPTYYDGYVVYYDDAGRPFYYASGAVVWISPAAPAYAGLVAHWRAHGPAYRGWYAHGGYRYRAYRGRR